ncbi:hypothetical protein CBR_g956 [Chara braunii]|uniref:Myb-like domain-containing protein n=1 Tax=Chara braunii TaxID=69332 RepID=A0A388KCQ6_CHABU|nr:hypothetical protein CBR_g956 [Chara braunii]|eukprot:GBG67835.1 hypothetical protein CBR_g956 [Chara braunii]
MRPLTLRLEKERQRGSGDAASRLPDLTTAERLLIMQLHSKLGDKWDKIAACVPGCTIQDIRTVIKTAKSRSSSTVTQLTRTAGTIQLSGEVITKPSSGSNLPLAAIAISAQRWARFSTTAAAEMRD